MKAVAGKWVPGTGFGFGSGFHPKFSLFFAFF
jgi:hypothetical protein